MQCICGTFKIKTQDIVEFVIELSLLSGIGTFCYSSIRECFTKVQVFHLFNVCMNVVCRAAIEIECLQFFVMQTRVVHRLF